MWAWVYVKSPKMEETKESLNPTNPLFWVCVLDIVLLGPGGTSKYRKLGAKFVTYLCKCYEIILKEAE